MLVLHSGHRSIGLDLGPDTDIVDINIVRMFVVRTGRNCCSRLWKGSAPRFVVWPLARGQPARGGKKLVALGCHAESDHVNSVNQPRSTCPSAQPAGQRGLPVGA